MQQQFTLNKADMFNLLRGIGTGVFYPASVRDSADKKQCGNG